VCGGCGGGLVLLLCAGLKLLVYEALSC
jgi:hypothetical protein